MKKLILLLFIPLVFACDDEDVRCLSCTNMDFDIYTLDGSFYANCSNLEGESICTDTYTNDMCFLNVAEISIEDGDLELWQLQRLKNHFESYGANCMIE